MISLEPGQKILHFRVSRKLGEGGMGEVYCADDLKLGRRVAIKVLPWQIRKNEKARQRFFQEARSASLLNHPNIVTIYSIEDTGDMDLIVMEYVEGKTLSSLIREGPLDIPAISDYGEQIAEALSTAHSAGVIHRDIKSLNILITARGKVKVLDFGLAKIARETTEAITQDGTPSLTEAGTVMGTVHYMSPEQIRGAVLDPRSDIFSLGCVLYEAATGRLPFTGPNIAAIMFQIATVEPPVPSSLRPDLPPEIDSIILRSLAKNKEQRYSIASELASDLHKLSVIPTQRFPVLDSAALSPGFPAATYEGTIVGREQELRRLEQALSQARSGKGKIVFVTGEAGIGKTSLSNQFVESARNRYPDLIIAQGQCVEYYGTAEAYLPLMDAIGSLLTGNLKERVTSVLRNNAPTWYLQFPSAFDSIGSLEKSQKESIGVTKERMLRELSDALVALSSFSPMILVLEDLHWADASTVDLLRYMCHRLPRLRILLLATFREDDVDSRNPPLRACSLELKTHSLSEEIALNALHLQDIQKYVDRLYPQNTFKQELISLIHRKTEGHPLFVTSLLQFLTELEILKIVEGRWVLTRPLGEMDLQVPESVLSMIRQKVEALTEEERRLLQYASVEGVEFLSIVLASLLGKDNLEMEEELSRISQTHRMIRHLGEEELPDGSLATRYRFVHALYQNVLNEDLVSARRVLLHRQTAELLLAHYGGQATRIAGKLAVHFKTGRDSQRAFEYFTIAGDNAAKLFANLEAASLYSNALQQLAEFLKKNPDQAAQWNASAIEVHEKFGDVLALSGFQKEAREEFEKAGKQLAGSNRLIEGRLQRKTAKAWETQRNMTEALKEYEISRDLLEEAGIENATPEWWNEWILLHLDKSWLHYTRNELGELDAISERVRPAVEKYGTPVQRSRFFQNRLYAYYRRHRYLIDDETLGYARDALQAALESDDPGQIAVTTFTNGFATLWHGDFDLAIDKLQDALQRAEKIGDAVLQSRCLTYLTVAYRKNENIEKIRELIPMCFDHCSKIRMEEYVAAAHANRAWLSLREGNLQEARTDAETAARIWTSLPLVSPFQGLALWPLISLIQNEDDIDPAIKYLRLILHPNQQRLSDELTTTMEKAIGLAEQGLKDEARLELKIALAQAQREKHL